MFKSAVGVVFKFALSIPSVIYGAKTEDKLSKEEFGREWEECARERGVLASKAQETIIVASSFREKTII